MSGPANKKGFRKKPAENAAMRKRHAKSREKKLIILQIGLVADKMRNGVLRKAGCFRME